MIPVPEMSAIHIKTLPKELCRVRTKTKANPNPPKSPRSTGKKKLKEKQRMYSWKRDEMRKTSVVGSALYFRPRPLSHASYNERIKERDEVMASDVN
jgi:hypothetical protein